MKAVEKGVCVHAMHETYWGVMHVQCPEHGWQDEVRP